ncbi:MAG TPA: peptidoglycan bridge formation glycyltransferase FemA/FemB family protein [Ktedonobacteraceae bacterium]|nr:peptidoglycan bridge formation glycyltransferase FemA/FemB family protein [Ktedonobacteraceae bacterium]
MHRYTLSALSGNRQEQWDSFIAGQPAGNLLQSWGWGELKARFGWHPLRLALFDSEQQTITAAALVLRRTAPGVPLRAGHLAYIPRGPIGDRSSPSYQILLSELHSYLKGQGAVALQVELPFEVDGEHTDEFFPPQRRIPDPACRDSGFRKVPAIQPARTILLDITPGEESLLAHMKEKWRYNLRLAQRKGVQIRVAQADEDVRNWYHLLELTGQRDDFGIHTLDYYLTAWNIFAPRNQGRLLLAEYDGQLLAGIFVGLMGRQAIYLYGASSNEQRNLMPNYLLQWEAIRWARSQGATCYDFWGIPETDDENEAMAGVYRFKSGWGGRVVRFPGNYEYVYRPLAMKIARKLL